MNLVSNPKRMDIESGLTKRSSGLTKPMTAYEVVDAFITLDQDKDGQITNKEFVDALKENPQIAEKFGLEQSLVLEEVPRERYDLVFGQIDYDHSQTVDVSLIARLHSAVLSPFVSNSTFLQIWELLKFYGHGNIKQAELAGVLSECGYKGTYLKEIVEKAPTPVVQSGTSFIHTKPYANSSQSLTLAVAWPA